MALQKNTENKIFYILQTYVFFYNFYLKYLASFNKKKQFELYDLPNCTPNSTRPGVE